MSEVCPTCGHVKIEKRFSKPTINEINDYCVQRNNKVDSQKFFDHYESNGWMVGRTAMKNWQAAVRNWEKSSYDRPQIQSGKRSPGDIREQARNQADSIVREKLGIGNGSDRTLRKEAINQLDGRGERTMDQRVITHIRSEVIEGSK